MRQAFRYAHPMGELKPQLSYAAERGEVDVVKRLLCAAGTPKQRKKLVNLADNENNTPLKFAASQGQKGVVQLLLENGAH